MKRTGKPTEFGLAAKTKLLEMGMNDSVLAEKVGVSRQYLCYIFQGRRSGAKYRNSIVNELRLDSKYLIDVKKTDPEKNRKENPHASDHGNTQGIRGARHGDPRR